MRVSICPILLGLLLSSYKLSLLDEAVHKDLEQDREHEETKIRIADNLPGEAVQESDIVIDSWSFTRRVTVTASTVLNAFVSTECSILRNCHTAIIWCFCIWWHQGFVWVVVNQIECDNWERVVLAIDAHKIEETD